MCVATSVVLDYRKNSGHNKNPGIMGQVSAEVNNGDLKVSYVPRPRSRIPLQAIWSCKSSVNTSKPAPIEATSRAVEQAKAPERGGPSQGAVGKEREELT